MSRRTILQGTMRRAFYSASGVLALLLAVSPAHAAVRVTLRTGFSYDCLRAETLESGMVRLFLISDTSQATAAADDYIELPASRILAVEPIPDPVSHPLAASNDAVHPASAAATEAAPTQSELHQMLAKAGQQHHIDEDLLASVVKAESGGHALAVSRTGARGLMQLMPSTANELGVTDAFEPTQNIAGGTAYLDQMLTRYHDNLAWALAAYNAGPAAVDHYHGVPPYRETQAYVARVIREFNRRKRASLVPSSHETHRGE